MALPPIVTDADRDWALHQCPPWARRSQIEDTAAEITDDDSWLDRDNHAPAKFDAPNWDLFVIEQIERFEKYFAHERKGHQDWSNLWRKSWWPKANPERRFPKMAPKKPHPFFRAGTPEFARAIKVATPQEATIWKRFNVAQFKPDDPRLREVQLRPSEAQRVAQRIIGEAAE